MPWTKKDYPDSMKNLPEKAKEKAIEIANSLVDEGYVDERAIAIAISRAKEWFSNRGESTSSDITHHLVPDNDQWVLKSLKSDDQISFDTKEDAMEAIKKQSKSEKMKVMIHDASGHFQKIY
jgi:uncharacterized protein YdaT